MINVTLFYHLQMHLKNEHIQFCGFSFFMIGPSFKHLNESRLRVGTILSIVGYMVSQTNSIQMSMSG